MVTPVRTSAYTQYNPYTPPTPGPVVPAPVAPGPTGPAPLIGVPKGPYGDPAWWKQRGGHELYAMFEQIEKQNPLAARAFWDQVVGRGRGENDLMAATIHKKFGGDMNAYNRWRNEIEHSGMYNRVGNFDLNTGKWSNSMMFPGGNPYGDQDFTFQGWDPSKMQVGLQSIPGSEEAGAESWNTYGAGAHFGLQGAQYPGVAQQASIAAGGTNPYLGQYNRVAGTGRLPAGGGPVPKLPARAGGAPSVPVPPPSGGGVNTPAPSPVSTGMSPTNPYGGSGRVYRHDQ